MIAGLEPDLVSYNVAVKACGSPPGIRLSRRQLDLGFSLLEEARSRGLTPDPRTYTSLFRLCAQAAEGRRALVTYQVPCTPLHRHRLTSSTRTALSPCNQELAADLHGRKMGHYTASSLYHCTCRCTFVMKLRATGLGAKKHNFGSKWRSERGPMKLKSLVQALVAEGAKLDVQCCTALISALGCEGLIDEALAVFQRMVSSMLYFVQFCLAFPFLSVRCYKAYRHRSDVS